MPQEGLNDVRRRAATSSDVLCLVSIEDDDVRSMTCSWSVQETEEIRIGLRAGLRTVNPVEMLQHELPMPALKSPSGESLLNSGRRTVGYRITNVI